MRAIETQLLRFLEGTDKQFIIPVYQRNYDWTIKQCKQLFNDLENIVTEDFRTHFLGSIVQIYSVGKQIREYYIIDGQQRLTTVSLLLLAIHNIINNNELDGSGVNIQKIINEYLIDKYSEQDTKVKLKPIAEDRIAYNKLFEDNEFILNSNITTNYQYFYKALAKSCYSLAQLYQAIEQLVIVEIELIEGEDDPQLIFESLNSTGLDLSEADKVRNFILMKQNKDKQVYYYNKYWKQIELNTKYDVSAFLRHYLTIKNKNIPNKADIYFTFKQFYNTNTSFHDLEMLLAELLKYSKVYAKIITSNYENKWINKYLTDLNHLETVVSYPFTLELLYNFKQDKINVEDCEETLKVIRDYVVRRFICEIPTNSLNKTFMTLHSDIAKHDKYFENYADICKLILIKKESYQRFPTDQELSEGFVKMEIYNKKPKNRIYILSELENYNHKELVDLERLIEEQKISIEHIMPRKLTSEWVSELGSNYQEIHAKYLNTIGNVTLTGYNAEMSNYSFNKKKLMQNGYCNSKFLLNRSIAKHDVWDEQAIVARANELQAIAKEIWQYPITSYVVETRTIYEYTLEDEKNFTGSKINSYILFGNYHEVLNWREFYENVIKQVYEHNDVIFNKIISGKLDNSILERSFVTNKSHLRQSVQITETIFVEINLSTEDKLKVLRNLFTCAKINYNELWFQIK